MPLILPSQRVIRPNPLAYPAGATPGIDRSHVAAQGIIQLSAVSGNSGNFYDVSKGIVGSLPSGIGTPKIDSIVGPSTLFSGNTVATFGQVGASVATVTMAAICVLPTLPISGNSAYLLTSYNTTAGFGNGIVIPSGTSLLSWFDYNTVSSNTIFDLSAIPNASGGAVFIALSVNGTSARWVVRSLNTGQVWSGNATVLASTGTDASVTISIGNRSTDYIRAFQGKIAAVMLAENVPAQLSIPQLLAWAADPWSFWYPRRTIQYTTPAATTTTSGGARIRQRWNRSALAYPAGATPGVDFSHPAAQRLSVSAIAASGANVLNLLNGGSGTPSGSISPQITKLGPSLQILTAASTAHVTLPKNGQPLAGGFTQAAIFSIASAIAVNYLFADEDVSGGNNNMAFRNDVSANNFTVGLQQTTTDTGLSCNATAGPFGVPYFAAWSAYSATQTASVVVKNLATGQVQFVTNLALGVAVTYNAATACAIGGRSSDGSRCFNGNIAAISVSAQPLSLWQLLQWSTDPWAFWYPNKTINLASSAAGGGGGSFLAAWARWINLPVIGTGNY